MYRFIIETYDQTSGQEEEMTFTDVDVATSEFKRLTEVSDAGISVTLRREERA